jgi:hypothetical protein
MIDKSIGHKLKESKVETENFLATQLAFHVWKEFRKK